MFRTLMSRCLSLFKATQLDADLDEELRSHIDLAIEENVALGMSQQEARRVALRSFGGMTQTREVYRMRRGLPLLETIARDLHFAIRQLQGAPGFAITAILTLALGLGANTAIFSMVDALLLRPLAVPHSEQLAMLNIHRSDWSAPSGTFSAPLVRALERHHDVFANVAGFNDVTMQVRGAAGIETVAGLLVSGQFFPLMQTPPLLGRYLTVDDDRSGSPGGFAAVISESYWRLWFNSAPGILGHKLVIDNTPFTIVGVMPRKFNGVDPTQRPSIYVPLAVEPVIDAPYNALAAGSDFPFLYVVARRNANVSLAQANIWLAARSIPIAEESLSDVSEIKAYRDYHFQLSAESGSKGFTYLRDFFRKPLIAVFSMCAAMLLLACLNLASLLMARATAREREFATRLAIGASRQRLVQQLLAESLLIALLGSVAGLAVAPMVSKTLSLWLLSRQDSAVLDTSLDARVLIFAGVLTIATTVLTGLVPALRSTSGSLNQHLKQAANARMASHNRRLLPRVLMSFQIAVALMLVVGAGLLATSLTRLYRTGLGFEPKGLINLRPSMDKQSLAGDALLRWYQLFDESLSHQPSVQSVSFEGVSPLAGGFFLDQFQTRFTNGLVQLTRNMVAPNYFATMQTHVLQGREFQWQDSSSATHKIILNQAAAKLLLPGENALGQTLLDHRKRPYEVIAIVEDAHYDSVRHEAPPTVYEPMAFEPGRKFSYIAVVRLNGPIGPFATAVRSLINRMAPDIPSPELTSMTSAMDASLSSERMMALLSVFFAACALLVTAIGIYGTLAYSTARRTAEIGVRIALGSQRLQVVLLIFRENAWTAMSGACAGLTLSLLGSRLLESFLYRTSSRDPWIILGSVAAITMIASAASLLPAVRAANLDPMQALRSE
jgi:predicted permease